MKDEFADQNQNPKGPFEHLFKDENKPDPKSDLPNAMVNVGQPHNPIFKVLMKCPMCNHEEWMMLDKQTIMNEKKKKPFCQSCLEDFLESGVPRMKPKKK